MKKTTILIVAMAMAFTLTGCGDFFSVRKMNVFEDIENEELLENSIEFVEIGYVGESSGDVLKYDTTTGIVYIDGYYVFTPYYAPNGLPYKYNPETNELEEIKCPDCEIKDEYIKKFEKATDK